MLRLVMSLSLAAALAGGASAAVSVIGSGPERICYESAEASRSGKADLGYCNEALENQVLSLRDRAATLNNRAVIYLLRGNAKAALADVDEAVRIAPKMPAAYVNKSAALFLLGKFEEARAAVDVALTLDASDEAPAAYFNRALAREAMGDIKGAYTDFQAAVAILPTYQPAREELARFRVSKR